VERRHSSNRIGHRPTTRIPRPPKWPRTGAIAVTPGAHSALVRFDSVTKQYGNADGRPALASLDLTIRQGEIIGIIGESGAGKSTLLQLINGLRSEEHTSELQSR